MPSIMREIETIDGRLIVADPRAMNVRYDNVRNIYIEQEPKCD